MKTKLYEKDECAPDAQSAIGWLAGHLTADIEDVNVAMTLSLFHEPEIIYFWQEKFYSIEYSCGTYEEVYELSDLKESIESYLNNLMLQVNKYQIDNGAKILYKRDGCDPHSDTAKEFLQKAFTSAGVSYPLCIHETFTCPFGAVYLFQKELYSLGYEEGQEIVYKVDLDWLKQSIDFASASWLEMQKGSEINAA